MAIKISTVHRVHLSINLLSRSIEIRLSGLCLDPVSVRQYIDIIKAINVKLI